MYRPRRVLMAYPLEQGLKPLPQYAPWHRYTRLNGLSTRTRIETLMCACISGGIASVLMAYPLEQGLKLGGVETTPLVRSVLMAYPLEQGLKPALRQATNQYLYFQRNGG